MIDFAWGLSGALAQCPPGSVAVVHDILSFSSTVNIAVGRGIEVLPYRSGSGSEAAVEYAQTQQAALAGGRWETEGLTLSPASIEGAADPLPARLVLPSPNGATISAALAEQGVTVIAGSLRSSTAIARWLADSPARRVISVAAGEHWPDGSLRPAVEDLLGAAALISRWQQFSSRSAGSGASSAAPQQLLSDQARLALAGYREAEGDLAALITRSDSGQELIQRGFAEDVRLACAVDVNELVPLYHPETSSFRPA